MAAFKASVLGDRAVLRVSGNDRLAFLQGLVTADVAKLAEGEACWAALLTPQGKILFDFLVVEQWDGYVIDCARPQLEALGKRFSFYKLRAEVSIEPAGGLAVAAMPPGGSVDIRPEIVFADPRLPEMGHRAIISTDYLKAIGDAGATDYRAWRIALGIPDSVEDIGCGELFPHEANLDQLGGVSFTKGCYVGQEVVSRMEHRGTARSRILPVTGERPLTTGSEISATGRLLGKVLSAAGRRGLALVRLDRLAETVETRLPIIAGEASISIGKPGWARFTVPGAAAA